MFANKETRNFLDDIRLKHHGELVFDNGLREDELAERHEKEKCVFLSAGRMIYRKGYDFLLDALMEIPESYEYEVRIMGDGPELERLRNCCSQNSNLSKHVDFLGAIPYTNIGGEYLKANAFIMPSIRETTGTVLLEAISKGLHVISLRKFGAATILDDNSAWLLMGIAESRM